MKINISDGDLNFLLSFLEVNKDKLNNKKHIKKLTKIYNKLNKSYMCNIDRLKINKEDIKAHRKINKVISNLNLTN